MNSLTREGKIIVFGGLALILFVVGIYFYYIIDRGAGIADHPTVKDEELIKSNATETLKWLVGIANELSDIGSGSVFNYEVIDIDGNSGNFGIYRIESEVGGPHIVDEHFVKFRTIDSNEFSPKTYYSEVDAASGVVASWHCPVADFAANPGSVLPQKILEARSRQFVERVYPEFTQVESMLEYDPGNKTASDNATNYFYRWNDLNYRKTLPAGVEIDLDPFIQVGITASGFIFSYDNTIPLYWSCKAWNSPSCIPIL